MTNEQKSAIVAELKRLGNKYKDPNNKKDKGQKILAKRAKVSTATISQMINGNWRLIRSEMWRKVKINLRIDWGWQTAEIENLKIINNLLQASQQGSMSICITHNAGAGKSYTYQLYERTYKNVIYIECKQYWSKKSYVRHLLIACGLDDNGTVEELIERFIEHLIELEKPLVIIDQFDKLKTSSMDLFMDFYNDLDGHCGFVLSGVPALKKHIESACQRDKSGYKEARSRFGVKYIPLNVISKNDVENICKANGVTDEHVIDEIYNTCEGDLRRVRRSIEKYFLMQN